MILHNMDTAHTLTAMMRYMDISAKEAYLTLVEAMDNKKNGIAYYRTEATQALIYYNQLHCTYSVTITTIKGQRI